MSLPYFNFYPTDFLGDANVAIMSAAEIGGYVALLCTAWQFGGKLPNDDVKLSKWARMSREEWASARKAIQPCFEVEGDWLVSRRMQAEHKKAAGKSESARASAQRRHHQPDANARRSQCERTANADAKSDANAQRSQCSPDPDPDLVGGVVAREAKTVIEPSEPTEPEPPDEFKPSKGAHDAFLALSAWSGRQRGQGLNASRGEPQEAERWAMALSAEPPFAFPPGTKARPPTGHVAEAVARINRATGDKGPDFKRVSYVLAAIRGEIARMRNNEPEPVKQAGSPASSVNGWDIAAMVAAKAKP